MGIDIIADYHIHTKSAKGNALWSCIFGEHASGSLKENVKIAYEKRNFREIAITDHGYRHFFGVNKDYYKEMRKEIDEVNSYFQSINKEFKVLLSAECNLINSAGDIDIDDNMLDYVDFLCVGYHKGAKKLKLSSIKENYTEVAIRAIEKYEISILHHPMDHVIPDLMEIGKVAVQRNTALELNRKHKNITIDMIQRLKKIGVKFSLGSDSHKPDDIGKFGIAYALAIKAGLSNDDIVNANGEAHRNLKLLKM